LNLRPLRPERGLPNDANDLWGLISSNNREHCRNVLFQLCRNCAMGQSLPRSTTTPTIAMATATSTVANRVPQGPPRPQGHPQARHTGPRPRRLKQPVFQPPGETLIAGFRPLQGAEFTRQGPVPLDRKKRNHAGHGISGNVTQLSNWNYRYHSGDAAKNTDRNTARKSDGPSGAGS
jgi:hypothetical protein